HRAVVVFPGSGPRVGRAGLRAIGEPDMMPPRSMRVLYVVHQFLPKYISGTEQYVLALARAGRACGDDVRVFTVDPDWNEPDRPEATLEHDVAGVPVTVYRFRKREIKNLALVDWWNPRVRPGFEALLESFRP